MTTLSVTSPDRVMWGRQMIRSLGQTDLQPVDVLQDQEGYVYPLTGSVNPQAQGLALAGTGGPFGVYARRAGYVARVLHMQLSYRQAAAGSTSQFVLYQNYSDTESAIIFKTWVTATDAATRDQNVDIPLYGIISKLGYPSVSFYYQNMAGYVGFILEEVRL